MLIIFSWLALLDPGDVGDIFVEIALLSPKGKSYERSSAASLLPYC